MKKNLFFLLIIWSSCNLSAQDKYRNQGFYNITQFSIGNIYDVLHEVNGIGLGEPSSGSKHIEVHTDLGLFIVKHHVTFGLGIGFAWYTTPEIYTMPVDMTLRFIANRFDNSLFLSFRVNGNVYINNVFKTGAGIRPGFGYKFFLNKKCYIVEAYWQRQLISMTPIHATFSRDKYSINSFGISFGIMPF